MSRRSAIRLTLPAVVLAFALQALAQTQTQPPTKGGDLLIKNATLLTATHGRVEHGSIYVKNGKIAAFGANISVPDNVPVLDAGGKFVTPGIIDSHSHMALDDDINEATSPVVPHMMMKDAFDYTDKHLYYALAGGVTSALLLHGSADMIGGQAVVIKTKYGLSRDAMIFPNAPRSIKFASGENPKRVFGGKGVLPSTRMGNFAVQRQALLEARQYMLDWDEYNEKVKKGDKEAKAPKRDLKLDALADVLRGKIMVQIHCYRADEFLTEMAMAKEFGYNLRGFHHALEAYKVPDEIAKQGVGIATFADWWGYKYEAWDAIPWNAVMSMRHGVKVAIKSDSDDYVRHLNQEAAKTMRYGGATEEEALQMVTLNAAWIIGIDDRVGSIDVGKDADLVLWTAYPLGSYALADKVWIDGQLWFDRSLPGYGMPNYREGQ
jgi:imidazolonepropionase-like amidohydrolase